MGAIDISHLSKKSGVPASTLRYYEEKDLIKSIGRNGLKRIFDDFVLEQLNFIALGQRAGFSLGEIREMLTTNGNYEINRKVLKEKADDIAQQVKQLVAIQKCLEFAADCTKCTSERHSECDKFQRLMRVAGKDQRRKQRASANKKH